MAHVDFATLSHGVFLFFVAASCTVIVFLAWNWLRSPVMLFCYW